MDFYEVFRPKKPLAQVSRFATTFTPYEGEERTEPLLRALEFGVTHG